MESVRSGKVSNAYVASQDMVESMGKNYCNKK